MTAALHPENLPATRTPVEIFLHHVFQDLPPGARPWVAGFRCDPYHPRARWGGCAVNGSIPDCVEAEANCYLAVSSFRPGDDGRINRRKSNFAALHLVMIDDVGTKVSFGAIALDPSYLLETSPGNYQAGYLLSEPVTDRALAESVIDALVAQGLATDGHDPGMKGVTRYGRLPVGINNKPRLVEEQGQPFRVRLAEWEPERRYALTEIIGAYGLKLGKPARRPNDDYIPPTDDPLLAFLAQRGHVQGPANAEGWVPISCPWRDEHTDRADTGAAYLPPSGFKCHHGHCENRTVHDLRAWSKASGWARDEAIDPDLAARCGIGGREPGEDDEPVEEQPHGASGHGFTSMTDFIARPPANSYRIKKVLPARGTGQIFGDSHVGKSFTLIDLCGHVAMGWDWHGFKTKRCTVLYIAAEGLAGLALRWRAWFDHHKATPPPNLWMHTVSVGLTVPGAADAIAERMSRLPERPALIALDTFATNFGAGSENCDEDMRAALMGLQALQGDGLILSAHHTGHGDKSRGRGHSSLFAALDVEIQATQDANGILTLTHTKYRDGARLKPIMSFQFDKVPLPWVDEDGDPLNSAVLVPTDTPQGERKGLNRGARIALEVLQKGCTETPDGWMYVADWRKAALAGGITVSDVKSSRYSAFVRALEELAVAKLIVSEGEKWKPI